MTTGQPDMSIKENLLYLFKIKPEETRLCGLMFLHAFFLGFMQVFLSTAAETLFLKQFDANTLPYMYMAGAGAVAAVGFAYSRLEKRMGLSSLLIVNLAVMLASLIIVRVFIGIDPKWSAVALYVWSTVVWVLVNLEFWGLAGRLFNLRQGKRLFGLIGSGEMIAVIIGGFSVSFLIKYIGTANLILVSATGVGVMLVILVYITRAFASRLAGHGGEAELREHQEEEKDGGFIKELAGRFKNRYVLLIFGFSALSWLGFYFADNIFFNEASARFPDEARLASFLGGFHAATGFASLFMRLFVSGWIISALGLGVGLLALPVAAGATALSFGIAGTAIGATPAVFWLAASIKFSDDMLRESVTRSSTLILYQPLPARERLATQMTAESVVDPLADAFAGAVLLLLTGVFAFSSSHLSYALFVIAAIWGVFGFALYRRYAMTLKNALARRTLGGFSLTIYDSSSADVLKKALESGNPCDVTYALNVMEEMEHESLGAFLIHMLRHADPDVRLDALSRIERLMLTEADAEITRLMETERSPDVRGALIRVLGIGASGRGRRNGIHSPVPCPRGRPHTSGRLGRAFKKRRHSGRAPCRG